MKKNIAILIACIIAGSLVAQDNKALKDSDAGALLERAASKYKLNQGMEADFTLTTVNPKLKPEESDSKYTTNDNGQLYIKGVAFKIIMNGNEIYCDGKTIWSYSPKSKEVQVNDYEDNQESFSPTKIFYAYKEGYSYQIKEKKTYKGKSVTVIEMAPVNHKVSYFKVDVAVDDATNEIIEVKIYEKSGVRYIYIINKLNNSPLADAYFTFDSKKHPGVKVVDLR